MRVAVNFGMRTVRGIGVGIISAIHGVWRGAIGVAIHARIVTRHVRSISGHGVRGGGAAWHAIVADWLLSVVCGHGVAHVSVMCLLHHVMSVRWMLSIGVACSCRTSVISKVFRRSCVPVLHSAKNESKIAN